MRQEVYFSDKVSNLVQSSARASSQSETVPASEFQTRSRHNTSYFVSVIECQGGQTDGLGKRPGKKKKKEKKGKVNKKTSK